MNIFIVGSGKLANELLDKMKGESAIAWENIKNHEERSIVIHAGSGREVEKVIAYCQKTGSILVELATGSAIEKMKPGFPVVLCPNINILMLKFMNMISKCGTMFKGYNINVVESHQSEKTSTPGTAIFIANALGLSEAHVKSIRKSDEQKGLLNIPEEHLQRHAVHQITIQNEVCSISMETRVYGASPYASGVSQLIGVLGANKLENRVYLINEFIEMGWL